MSANRQLCTFYLDGLLFGVDLQNVQEVMRFLKMTRVPLASPAVCGLLNLRGQIVTAVDPRRRVMVKPMGLDSLSINGVVRAPHGPGRLVGDEVRDGGGGE